MQDRTEMFHEQPPHSPPPVSYSKGKNDKRLFMWLGYAKLRNLCYFGRADPKTYLTVGLHSNLEKGIERLKEKDRRKRCLI